MNSFNSPVIQALEKAEVVFWDFDGVIKESTQVKSNAYRDLFSGYGESVVKLVDQHHSANGGVSRFEKIPLYLRWAGESATDFQVELFCENFSKLVVQKVIDSAWVSGVYHYILNSYSKKKFILVTATPQNEIELIVDAIGLKNFFNQVYGSPLNKADAISKVLHQFKINPERSLMVGDSKTDLIAARLNSVPFILRATTDNLDMQINNDLGLIFKDLYFE